MKEIMVAFLESQLAIEKARLAGLSQRMGSYQMPNLSHREGCEKVIEEIEKQLREWKKKK